MKKNILWSLAIALGLFATACVEDDNPDISEHPWNYKLTPVNVGKVPTGILMYNPSSWWSDAQIMRRLEEEYDAETGKYGPYVKVAAGQYELFGTNRDYHEEYAQNLGVIVENVKKAKIDYIITPHISEDRNKMFPNNISAQDTVFINMLSGHTDTLQWKNDGSMGFAIRFNAQNVADGLGCKDNNTLLEDCSPREYRLDNGQTVQVPAREVFLNFVRRLSWFMTESTYFHFHGRPVLVIDGLRQLYSRDPRALYDDMRSIIKNEVGKDVYIIARQTQWTPPARWQHFWIEGHADAVVPEKLTNLENGIGWDRFDLHNILINEHMKVNREYYANCGINYIPSVSPGFSFYVQDGRWDYPIIQPDPQDFRERCWSAKMQLGSQPMVIVDAYNEWNFANAVEPADPEYGNGWGDTYLNIIAEEFGQ
ncbi:hypothetical protein [Muribaculum intestinale]|jgi:hypothetical protein|uniref:Uncharacterized protein n=1 Tax=Muribaculum intestinale TaxID=1796646 RepID=A0A4S2FYR0_9BACT|nr:hypothetical protein [Muribaculum intestinale]MYM12289.1 hypothetical protein [Muribaculum intestinale]ROT11065.1 hypothetical protein EEL42_02035 [Muribaculaceae bacterium Isolate-100 (HZI)]RXE64748.1 hypothetical protein ED388_10105 [Muribaculaceae bacterium Isolate-007 (NCI)]TGY74538.1 hypothetical protein E5333_06340 [Muribaculum intestinale]